MIRAAGYCRVSTDHEDQANSFEAQQRYFREYIGRQPGWSLYGIYADSGITGTSTQKRVQFNRMMEDARRGCFDLILTKEVSRFSRNILDTISCTRELKGLGIAVVFLADGISTLDPDAELRLSIMASIAQEESRKTSARVTWGQTRQMERGVVFGHSLLGYEVRNGTITVEPSGAETVKRIFQAYVHEKKGPSAIARELEAAGIRTSAGNIRWTAGTVLKILKNEKYAGDLIQKKTCTPDYLTHRKAANPSAESLVVIRNHHEPIVSRELWNAAEEQRLSRKNSSTVSSSRRYPLSGKILCGECGGRFISRIRQRKDGTFYRRWGCGTAAYEGVGCEPGSRYGCHVGRMLRDDCAMEVLRTVLESLEFDRDALIREVLMDSGTGKEKAAVTRSLERIREKRERALDAFLCGTISESELAEVRERYGHEAETLQKQLENLSASDDERNEEYLKRTARDILAGKTDSTGFWQNLVERITVYRDGRVTVKLCELETVWEFRWSD